MKKFLILMQLFFSTAFFASAQVQTEISQDELARIYEEVKTPYKYGMVIAPQDNGHKIDCPTVFREGDSWYMTYVVYNGKTGQDGRGYETWLAKSSDLLHWKTLGRVLAYRDGKWDCNQRGGFPALADMEWGGTYQLQQYKGRHWMTYLGGSGTGYESVREPLYVGVASTDKPITEAHEWQASDKPILHIDDKDAQWWEKLTQYKSTVYWDKSKRFGKQFVMFYNAAGVHPQTGKKAERVGIALSDNMKKWTRYAGNPVFAHEIAGGITGDAHIQRMGDFYVMFYFSAFDPKRTYKAFNTFAVSRDLVHWTDWQGADLIIPSKEYDELFAHKSYVVKHDGVVYHFYCAVNNADQRGIAVATSRPMGQSDVRFPVRDIKSRRIFTELNRGWKTWLVESTQANQPYVKLHHPVTVNLPHNWDDYYGYRQLTHGNLHGTALYTRSFEVRKQEGRRYFLQFEGIGTYATIALNGKAFSRQPVGRTTLTLDVTDVLVDGENRLEVKAEHPELIADMPWVCGGCSSEWGFSEGSQPLGIFRPVTLVETDEVRIEPFGVHIWNNEKADSVFVDLEIKNYSKHLQEIEVVNKLSDADGRQTFRLTQKLTLKPGELRIIRQQSPVKDASRWSTEKPYLYKLASMIKRSGKTTDEVSTPFGIRTLSWPVKRFTPEGPVVGSHDGRFFLNGIPTFLNGVCEYEHQFGQSHAFSKEQVLARVKGLKAAGFNAFRDAHQPHHLDYQTYFDREGMVWWTQFSAHVWYDTPEFRENFKKLLRQWVKERRNSPSLSLWGLQNESTLPREFAEECCDIIREMDPTAVTMRPITTCNGGDGSDWNVIQNWSGTYGGDIYKYGHELSRPNQLLNGEYGAWRSIDLHTEPAAFDAKGIWSEERMCLLMETKIRQAESVKDSVCGQFQWIYSSHDNPGRRQPDEALRRIDKVGPFNYKGLVTPWEEPLDVYYMYKSNYRLPEEEPMVYLVSHTWNNRFEKSGRRRATIEAYSNCDSVLLYNDATNDVYLGRKVNHGRGTHFTWENRDIRYNVLRAVGYYDGKPVAEDVLVLKGLERAPHFEALYRPSAIVPTAADNNADLLKPASGYTYLYRINCGGDAYTDSYGEQWMQDSRMFSHSWAEKFDSISPYQASQRTTFDPIHGTRDWALFQSFRFGRHHLNYRFPVSEPGRYRIELYFTEPWHGTGGGEKTDCEGFRIFDVAVNGKTLIDDLDIWAKSGHDGAFRRVVEAEAVNGELLIDFPEVKSGQAIICAIAIAKKGEVEKRPMLPLVKASDVFSWSAMGADTLVKMPKEMLPEDKNTRSVVKYQAEEALVKGNFEKREYKKETGIFFGKSKKESCIIWEINTGLAQVYALRFKFMNSNKQPLPVRLQFIDAKGVVLKDDWLRFAPTPGKWRMLSTTTGTFINAGHYKLILSADSLDGFAIDGVEIQ